MDCKRNFKWSSMQRWRQCTICNVAHWSFIWWSIIFNPISAGVLENQDMLPSKSHVLCPNMTNDTSLESSCALLLESAKNLQIWKNWIFYRKIQFYIKVFAKKNLSKKWQIIHFWKALLKCHFKYAKKFLQNFK